MNPVLIHAVSITFCHECAKTCNQLTSDNKFPNDFLLRIHMFVVSFSISIVVGRPKPQSCFRVFLNFELIPK